MAEEIDKRKYEEINTRRNGKAREQKQWKSKRKRKNADLEGKKEK